MLKEASTHLTIPEPSEDLIVNEPWSIDIYADGLMDELFADIDYILDGNGNLPSQTVRHGSQTPLRPHSSQVGESFRQSPGAGNPATAMGHHVGGSSTQDISLSEWLNLGNSSTAESSEYEPLQTVTVPQVVLPNTLRRPQQPVAQIKRNNLSRFMVGNPTGKLLDKKHQKTKRAIGKLVIVGTTLGVAIAGTIYLLQPGVIHLLNTNLSQQALQVPQSQSELPTKAEAEAELVDYMLEALAVIDKQDSRNNQNSARPGLTNEATANQTALALPSIQPAGNLPPLLAANNTPPAANRSGSVVERIYIPVYQAPSPMRYALPSIPGSLTPLPPIATASKGYQPNPVKAALNTVRQAAKPVAVNMVAAAVRGELKPVAIRTAPITVRQAPNLLPGLPVLPLRPATPDSEPTITQEQVYLPTAVAVAPANTLEGLLELGNKSAALFKIDGVSRRVDVGESIGSSGWTLVEVSNGEAVIRRNGEVRSIYVGQQL
ncbi:hypothetical protein WKK05_17635 [Nostoc sp. UHCC 0302]|uniref:hypothetical protein n=1 Tax=Nostoc sp. UHCC 0302 TaxID=3134896 RepID=UPI00311C9E41